MVSIMVPAYNEEKYLSITLENILQASRLVPDIPIEIIVVNDGSTDRTGAIVAEYEQQYDFIRSVHHQINEGFGCSLKDALKAARYPKFAIVPGDNDFTLDLIQNVLQNSRKADLMLIFYLNREMRGRRRNTMSLLFSTIYMVAFDVFVQYINGGILYPTERLRQLDIKSSRFSIIAELVIKCLRSGCSYYEIPGYMQTGLDGSTSLSFRNLKEVAFTFVRLIWEIYVEKRAEYSHKPQRIF